MLHAVAICLGQVVGQEGVAIKIELRQLAAVHASRLPHHLLGFLHEGINLAYRAGVVGCHLEVTAAVLPSVQYLRRA